MRVRVSDTDTDTAQTQTRMGDGRFGAMVSYPLSQQRPRIPVHSTYIVPYILLTSLCDGDGDSAPIYSSDKRFKEEMNGIVSNLCRMCVNHSIVISLSHLCVLLIKSTIMRLDAIQMLNSREIHKVDLSCSVQHRTKTWRGRV